MLFAVAAGLSVANIYCAQPLLDAIAASFGFSKAAVGSVITLTQIGYALGLFFIVPLGDLVDRRRLILSQLLLAAGALLLVSFSSTKLLLLLAMFFVGLLAVVVQVLVAFAAGLARPEERGRAVGTVTSGVVLGILLARIFAGAMNDLAGWRAVYLVSACLTLLLACILFRVLPAGSGASEGSYIELLGSVIKLYKTTPILRIRAALALLLFAAFSILWTSLVLPLSDLPHPLTHTAIGLFGLAGVAGAAAAGRAGALADKEKGQWTTGFGLLLLSLSWILIGGLHRSLWILVIGIVLLDFAVQAVHVTSQSMIFAARPDAKSRLVAAYMVFYSLGSGVGAIASTRTYAHFGWTGVCLLGGSVSVLALGVWALTLRASNRSAPLQGSEISSCHANATLQ